MSLSIGMVIELEKNVENKDSAKSYGSGLVDVFATPAMIAFMEQTCLQLAQKGIAKEEGTVGTLVNVTHTKATPIGMKVWCQAKLAEIEKRRLVFEVIARDEEGEIGRGMHERFIINTEKFMAKFAQK